MVLEVNPRPPASMALYPDVGSVGVLRAHLRACLHGELPRARRGRYPAASAAARSCYAPRALRLDEAAAAALAAWPDVHDLPHAGHVIRRRRSAVQRDGARARRRRSRSAWRCSAMPCCSSWRPFDDRSIAPLASSALSVNAHAAPLVERLLREADALRVQVRRDDSGVCIVDAGIDAPGSIAAGLLIGEICMGGFGTVGAAHRCGRRLADLARGAQLAAGAGLPGQPVRRLEPGGEQGGDRRQEVLLARLGPGARAGRQGTAVRANSATATAPTAACWCSRSIAPPPDGGACDKVLRDCALAAEALTLILTPTTSLAGTTQVVARVLEVALHKAHELGFALAHIVDGAATAPLPAPSPDGVQAMGRTNDAILYGGRVHLNVRGSDDAARELAQRLPSRNSRDYGRSFAEIFKAAEYDFYKIDPALVRAGRGVGQQPRQRQHLARRRARHGAAAAPVAAGGLTWLAPRRVWPS